MSRVTIALVMVYIAFALIFFLYLQTKYSKKKFILIIKKNGRKKKKYRLKKENVYLDILNKRIELKYEQNNWNVEIDQKKQALSKNNNISISDNYSMEIVNGGLCFEAILWIVIAVIMFIIMIVVTINMNNQKEKRNIVVQKESTELSDDLVAESSSEGLNIEEHYQTETENFEETIEDISLGDMNLERRRELATHICAGIRYSLALLEEGTVKISNKDVFSDFDFEEWNNLESISGKSYIIVGLNKNGDVYSTCLKDFSYDSDVSDWHDIIQVETGDQYAVGLTSKGEVVHIGRYEDGQRDVRDWKNIKQIASSHRLIVGLGEDGMLHFAGFKAEKFEAEYNSKIQDWKGVISIYASGGINSDEMGHVVGLRQDGTIVSLGDKFPSSNVEISDLDDISLLALGDYHLVAISSSDTLSVVGDSGTIDYAGQSQKEKFVNWPSDDIVELTAGFNLTLALTSEGEVYGAGNEKQGQLEVNGWENIMTPISE